MIGLISRDEAIKQIDEAFDVGGCYCDKYTIRSILRSLPTIEERIESEWINDIRYSGWTCKHCNYHDGNRTDKYCPYCGAKMGE